MLKFAAAAFIPLSLVILPAAANADDTAVAKKKERRICKRDVMPGSLLAPRRICLTAAEWDQTNRLNRRTVDEWQNKVGADPRR